jgi:GT2 family glycosyltransferase
MATKLQELRVTLPQAVVPGKIGVVTVLFNSSTVLPDFFASINRQTYTNYAIYCVDNASKDDSIALCAAQAGAYHVIASTVNVGVASGNNMGVRAAIADGCEYVMLLNNDVEFGPELFAQLVVGLAEHSCPMTTPMIYYHDRPDVIWSAGARFEAFIANRAIHNAIGVKDTGQYTKPEIVGHSPTCCLLVHCSVFDAIGLFDETMFVYGDDNEFTFRAMQAAHPIYLLPHAKLYHKVSSLTGTDSPFSMRHTSRGRAYFIAKHYGRLATAFWTMFYKLYYFLRRLSGKDTAEAYRIKTDGWSEGLDLYRSRVHAAYKG